MTAKSKFAISFSGAILSLMFGLAAISLAVCCSFFVEKSVFKSDIFFPKNGEAFEPQNVQITASRLEIPLEEMKNLNVEGRLPVIVVPQWNDCQVTIEYWRLSSGGPIYYSVAKIPINLAGNNTVERAVIKGNKEVWIYTKPNHPASITLGLFGIICIVVSIILLSSSIHKLRK